MERAWQAATESSLLGMTEMGHLKPRASGGSNV
jgi:hypothetical protein